MIWILFTIVVATTIGIYSERRWPERAGTGSRRGLLLILYFVLPPIVFFNLVHLELDFAAGAGILLGLVSATLLGTLAWVIAVPVMKLPRPTAGALICCAILANTSYLGYPMVYALMGGDELTKAVLYDVVVSYLTLMLGAFAVGAAFGTKAGEGFRERFKAFLFKNPLICAAILGLLAPAWLAPDLAVEISRILVVVPLIVGFFAVGAILAEEQREGMITLPPRLHPPVVAVIFCRLLVAPSLLFVLTLPLTGVPPSYFLLAAMPTGLNSMIVGHAYGLELRIMAESIVYTTTIVVLGAAGWALLL